jgi:hypothetical protein
MDNSDRACLRPREWDQLLVLVDAPAPISAKGSTRGELTGQEASVGLRKLRCYGLASYAQNEWTHEGRWSATADGHALVRRVLA